MKNQKSQVYITGVAEMQNKIRECAEKRRHLMTPEQDSAFRLVNGFTEDMPFLAVDIFAKTAVIHDYSKNGRENFTELAEQIIDCLGFPDTVILKRRSSRNEQERRGILLCGTNPATEIREHGVTYRLDLMMNQDCSFYPDTRNLRRYLLDHSANKSVLNTFAYMGSLGIAAKAGGAEKVVQTDLSEKFLTACANPAYPCELRAGDFFPLTAAMRKQRETFDCVILDPPFFSKTAKGTVDLAGAPLALIGKVRPLVKDGGRLIVVNNALELSGADFIRALDGICDGTYLTRGENIPVPEDFTGNGTWRISPTPFNHPTKIQVLNVRRKEGSIAQ